MPAMVAFKARFARAFFFVLSSVMPALKREARLRADVAGIHVFLACQQSTKTWMAGS
jgi:hypothetical protein